MTTWINDDDLVVKFGTVEAEKRNVGAYNVDGNVHWVEVIVDFSELPAVASNSVILNDHFQLPAGAFIENVTIVTTTDFDAAGMDAPTFSLGTIDTDRTSNPDVDALVAAATETELNQGGANVAGWVGAAVGALLTSNKLLTWEVDTAAFTAGLAVVRINWHVPPVTGDTLVWSKS